MNLRCNIVIMKSPVRDPQTSMPIVPSGIAIVRLRASDRSASAHLCGAGLVHVHPCLGKQDLLDSRMLLNTY